MTNDAPAIATRRFGLGARPGDVGRIRADPRGYVASQIGDREIARLENADLAPSHTTIVEVIGARQRVRAARRDVPAPTAATPQPPGAATALSPAAQAAPTIPAEPMPGATDGAPAMSPADRPGRLIQAAMIAEAEARIRRAVATEAPFVERLVMFWSNHFAAAARKGNVRAIAGAYEREAIRPHVFGRFADMLLAVARHPAMLIYLDNQGSIGPNSRAGTRRGRGLNENLARELLELHTLGVDGGYTQADVAALARLLTGWTFGGPERPAGEAGRFWFAANRHEPGPHRLLGREYRQGATGGEQALADLAGHPSTARHVATKLAAHFVASPPPPTLVARLERRFRETDGDLAALSLDLVSAPEAWAAPAKKMLPPYDFLVSLSRGLAIEVPPRQIMRFSVALGQPMWDPPSPKGWPDDDDAWMAPAALRERLRIAEVAAARIPPGSDPRAAARDLLGAALSPATAEAVARAESARQGYELLILSPDLQRR